MNITSLCRSLKRLSAFRHFALAFMMQMILISFVVIPEDAYAQRGAGQTQGVKCSNNYVCQWWIWYDLDANVCLEGVCYGGSGGTVNDGTCYFSWKPGCCRELQSHVCKDDFICTDDVCDFEINRCTYPPIPGCCDKASDCNDNDFCTVDICRTDLTCWNYFIPGCCYSDADCSDNNRCTYDVCNEQLGCENPPTGVPCCNTDADCNDNIACTSFDECSPIIGCIYTRQIDACDDGNACTDDICRAFLGCRFLWGVKEEDKRMFYWEKLFKNYSSRKPVQRTAVLT